MASQLWGTSSLGGYFSNNTLSKKVRELAQPLCKFRQFCDLKDAKGANAGDKVLFDKLSNVGTAGSSLSETSTIPETNFTITQGTATMTEYGNSIPYTGKLEALSEYDPKNLVQRALRNDMAKVLDKAAAAQFVAGDTYYICLTASTGTCVQDASLSGHTATSNLNTYHVRAIVDYMKNKNIPRYNGKEYVCVASINSISGLYDDLEDVAKYADKDFRFTDEVGRYYGVRFVLDTNYLVNTCGHDTTGTYGEAVFFGADAVMEAVAVPEELRAKVPGDYGRSQGVAWYALLGFQKIWDYTGDGQENIVYVTDVFGQADTH